MGYTCTCARETPVSISRERLDGMPSNLVCRHKLSSYVLYACQRYDVFARARVHTPFLYLGNGWDDCVQTLCVAWDQLDMCLTQVRDGVHMHVRTCIPRFYISGTAVQIVLKLGVQVGTH